MSQADTTIGATAGEDKPDTAVAQALDDARARRRAATRAALDRAAAAGATVPARPPRRPDPAAAPAASAPRRAAQPVRQAVTLEAVRHRAPNTLVAEKLARAFVLDLPDCEAIADGTEEHVGKAARLLDGHLSEKALALHLQRVVAGFVGAAFSSAQFYQQKASEARDLTSKLANEDRDEDRGGVYGFEDKAQRARAFAAQVGLQAYAALAAAEGAVSAFAQVAGEDWKPYQPAQPASQTLAHRSAAEEIAAFEG